MLRAGAPTVAAIVGQKVFPGVLDPDLGETAYDSKQIEYEPRDLLRPDNLYAYVPGLQSARGKFGERSRRTSVEVSFDTHRRWFMAGAAALLGAMLLSARKNVPDFDRCYVWTLS